MYPIIGVFSSWLALREDQRVCTCFEPNKYSCFIDREKENLLICCHVNLFFNDLKQCTFTYGCVFCCCVLLSTLLSK